MVRIKHQTDHGGLKESLHPGLHPSQVPAAAIEATPVQHTTSTAATKGRSPHWSYGFPRFVALSENGIYTYTIIYPQNGHFDGGHDDGLVSLGVPFFRQTHIPTPNMFGHVI